MLIILDEKTFRTPEEVEQQYPDSKFILLYYGDIQSPRGNLYCVSTSNESFREICERADEFVDHGIPCMLSGSYNNGGAFGVQYEIES